MTDEPTPRLRLEDIPYGDTSSNAEMATWWLTFWRQEQARGVTADMAYLLTLTYTFLDRFEMYGNDEHYIYATAAVAEVEEGMREEKFAPDHCRGALIELEMLNTKVQKGLMRRG